MKKEDSTLAARFFFNNCAVSLHLPGELKISRTLKPEPGDVVLDRDFIPAGWPSEFIGEQSDFYKFLDVTSLSNASLLKKLTAIGYMLCNKLPRGGRRCRAFLCVNEDREAYANGKTFFAKAIAQLSNSVAVFAGDAINSFDIGTVNENTNLLILDDARYTFDLCSAFDLCTGDWRIERKAQPELVIPRKKAPYLIITSNATKKMLRNDGSFRRRFAVLEFSSMFGPENPIDKFIGRLMFHDWGSAQWHMFDNLMFYCVLEYLRSYDRGEDVFSLY